MIKRSNVKPYQVACVVDQETKDKLLEISKQKGLPVGYLIREGIKLYLKSLDSKETLNNDGGDHSTGNYSMEEN